MSAPWSIRESTLRKPYKSRIICLLPRSQRQPLQSYQPWGCYLRRIIDSERVCKLACKRAEEDCSASVAWSATRCKAPSIKRLADALASKEYETHHLHVKIALRCRKQVSIRKIWEWNTSFRCVATHIISQNKRSVKHHLTSLNQLWCNIKHLWNIC